LIDADLFRLLTPRLLGGAVQPPSKPCNSRARRCNAPDILPPS